MVLSEAFIPDPSIYTFPSLTAEGPGPWHFGFFLPTNGFAEELIAGNEFVWVDRFIDSLEVVKGAVTPDDVAVYADYLRDPAHLKATLSWFRTWPQDMVDNAAYQKTKLPMPVPAIGAQGSLGDFVADNVRCHRRRNRKLRALDLRGTPRRTHPDASRLPVSRSEAWRV